MMTWGKRRELKWRKAESYSLPECESLKAVCKVIKEGTKVISLLAVFLCGSSSSLCSQLLKSKLWSKSSSKTLQASHLWKLAVSLTF